MDTDNSPGRKPIPEESMLCEKPRCPGLSVGIPCEDPSVETRLPLTPEGVSLVVEEGHSVYVQRGAGRSIAYTDLQYSEAGAFLVDDAAEVFGADIVLKTSPPTPREVALMKNRATVMSLLQINNLSKECLKLMMSKRLTAVVYELLQDSQKAFPVVSSLSEIEGICAISVVSELMTCERGGKGLLLGSVAGIPPTEVVILGAGIASRAAARTALAIGAEVKVFDHDVNKLRQIKQQLGEHIFTSVIHPKVLFRALASADAVISNLRYINGSERFMVSEDLVKTMKRGAIIVDLGVDQGGSFETSRCMTLRRPLYEVHGVRHYCVPNLSARVPRTATMAMSNLFAPILLKIGLSGGVRQAVSESAGFRHGVYLYEGKIVNRLIGRYYGITSGDIGLTSTGY